MTLLQRGTIDIWMNDRVPPSVRKVLIFNENEHGHAGYLALRGIAGWVSPTLRITSHLINNIMFNQTLDPNKVGWEVYMVGDVALVNINEWPNTALFPIEDSKASWINGYPVVRDTLKFFSECGAEQLMYFTTSSIHEMLDEGMFPPIGVGEYREVGYCDGSLSDDMNDEGIFLTPPAWLFPHFANLMGYDNAATSVFGFDSDESVNAEVGKTMGDFVKNQYGLKTNKKWYKMACDEMQDLTERVDNIQKQMEELMKEKPANNTMWG